jgi:hypothetical protein
MYEWKFTGVARSGSGIITTDPNCVKVPGCQLVTDITGDFDGFNILELLPLGSVSGNDNLVFPDMSPLLSAGFAFSTGGNGGWKLFYLGDPTKSYNDCIGGPAGCGGNEGTFSLTAVPGPIVGAGIPGLVMAGVGLLGWWWRRKQKPVAIAA